MDTPVYGQLVRSTGFNLGWVISNRMEAILWEQALTLWDLRLSPGIECQNRITWHQLVCTGVLIAWCTHLVPEVLCSMVCFVFPVPNGHNSYFNVNLYKKLVISDNAMFSELLLEQLKTVGQDYRHALFHCVVLPYCSLKILHFSSWRCATTGLKGLYWHHFPNSTGSLYVCHILIIPTMFQAFSLFLLLL